MQTTTKCISGCMILVLMLWLLPRTTVILPQASAAVGDFVTTWDTTKPGSSNSDQITIPTTGAGYNYSVNWGDGSSDTGLTGDATHTYAASGVYTVMISGDFPRIYFNGGGDAQKLLTVEQWGTIAWTSMESAFSGCSNLTINAADAPDLTLVTDMSSMFKNATSMNQDISSWDVSGVTSMISMFEGASTFNRALGAWDMSSALSLGSMFKDARAFNQDLSAWNVSNVLGMINMFDGSALSSDNYDNLLISWAGQSLEHGVALGAADTFFCSGQAARDAIIAGRTWTITDAGKGCVAPVVTGVAASTPNGTYGVGENIRIQVTFNSWVDVTGTPRILLETGDTDRYAVAASGSTGTVITFTYTVQAGDTAADLEYVNTSSLALSGGTIYKRLSTTAAVLTLPAPSGAGSLSANSAIVIDTTPASSSSSSSESGNTPQPAAEAPAQTPGGHRGSRTNEVYPVLPVSSQPSKGSSSAAPSHRGPARAKAPKRSGPKQLCSIGYPMLAERVHVNDRIYTDVEPVAWYHPSVLLLTKAGYAKGSLDGNGQFQGTFRPADRVTALEGLTLLLRTRVQDGKPELLPKDDGGTHASEYRDLAAFFALPLSDKSDGEGITRAEFLDALLAAFCIDREGAKTSMLPYADVSALHPNAKAIAVATTLGIVAGDGNTRKMFRPDEPLVRAEMAKILQVMVTLEDSWRVR